MAVNIDDLATFFGDFFNNEQSQDAFQENPVGFLNQNGFGNVTAFEVQTAANRVFAPDQGATTAASAGGAGAPLLHPLPDHAALEADPGGGGLQAAIEAVDYYTNVYNTTYDNDQAFDTSTNTNVTAFGPVDLDQDIDNNIATGAGAVAGVEDSAVATGGGVAAGDDIEDSNVVTGNVEDAVLADDISDSQVLAGSNVGGSVVGDDVNDSILGNDNQAIIDSQVGAASFGSGDATNVEAENAVLGDGTIVDGNIQGNANIGSGTQTVVENSNLSESAVGGSAVESNDINVTADDGAAVAFGGGDASGNNQDVDITNDDGTVQVAGDDASLDQSYTSVVDDSFNEQTTDIDESFNDLSSEVIQSDDTNVAQAGDDADVFD